MYVECGCSQLVTLCTLHNLCYNIKISRIVIDGEVITVSGSIPQIVVDKHVINIEGKMPKHSKQNQRERAQSSTSRSKAYNRGKLLFVVFIDVINRNGVKRAFFFSIRLFSFGVYVASLSCLLIIISNDYEHISSNISKV